MKRHIIIGIGGAHSGVGKTTLAVALLKYLTKGDKPSSPHLPLAEVGIRGGGRWGAIKYTKTALSPALVDDSSVLGREGKDTRKMLDAGAEEVLWVLSPPGRLGEVLPAAAERLSHLDGIIVEGNSAIEFLKPDIVIFLDSTSREKAKSSAARVRNMADILMDRLDEKAIGKLITGVAMTARKKSIEEFLREKAVNGRITCALARKIAEDLGVSYKEVGAAANELQIKIKNCELGCF